MSQDRSRLPLAQRWAALDKRIKMTLRLSVLATLLVNAATGWAFLEFGRASGHQAPPPPPPYIGQAATGDEPTWSGFGEWP